jgi:hypothetical protein
MTGRREVPGYQRDSWRPFPGCYKRRACAVHRLRRGDTIGPPN